VSDTLRAWAGPPLPAQAPRLKRLCLAWNSVGGGVAALAWTLLRLKAAPNAAYEPGLDGSDGGAGLGAAQAGSAAAPGPAGSAPAGSGGSGGVGGRCGLQELDLSGTDLVEPVSAVAVRLVVCRV
jgi:hypothetical protein